MFTLLMHCLIHAKRKPTLQSVLPTNAISQIYAGQLPKIITNKIILKGGEQCRYVEMGAIVTKRKYFCRWNSGTSNCFRKDSGSYHATFGESVPQYDTEFTKGFLYFTDQRVLFVANKNGFERKLSQISAVTAYTDAIALQFGSKTYSIMLPDGNIARMALNLLV